MRVLIRLDSQGLKNILVELPAKVLVKEVGLLIRRGEYSKAIIVALSKGRMLGELDGKDLGETDAHAILTQQNVHYDLTR